LRLEATPSPVGIRFIHVWEWSDGLEKIFFMRFTSSGLNFMRKLSAVSPLAPGNNAMKRNRIIVNAQVSRYCSFTSGSRNILKEERVRSSIIVRSSAG